MNRRWVGVNEAVSLASPQLINCLDTFVLFWAIFSTSFEKQSYTETDLFMLVDLQFVSKWRDVETILFIIVLFVYLPFHSLSIFPLICRSFHSFVYLLTHLSNFPLACLYFHLTPDLTAICTRALLNFLDNSTSYQHSWLIINQSVNDRTYDVTSKSK